MPEEFADKAEGDAGGVAPEDPAPLFAGKYRLVREIGRGGMGSVWLAEHATLRMNVVVKRMHHELALRADTRARFDREARAAASLRSPNVVRVIDHGVTEQGVPYLVMEHLEGESVRQRLAARGRLSLAETAAVLTGAAKGLAAAHEAGLVHRDVKPDNLFLARGEEDEETVKVLDFGIAKVPDALAMEDALATATGALLGTPSYMSPEQAQGAKALDARSDVWSLGVVGIECITGREPFVAGSLGALVRKIAVDPLPVPSELAPDANVPAAVDAWASRALERTVSARFAGAKELAVAFEAAVAGAPESGVPPRVSVRPHGGAVTPSLEFSPTVLSTRSPARTRRPGFLVLALAVVLVVAAAVWLVVTR